MKTLKEKMYDGFQEFSERELMDLIDEAKELIKDPDAGRWTQDVEAIIEVKDKLFCIDFRQGLTEYQENEYDNQPYEVVEETVIVETVVYRRV